jgi:hypothetical protein
MDTSIPRDVREVSPAISRKRKYRQDMSSTSAEDSRQEIMAIKNNQKVSPGTGAILECMLQTYDKLQEMDKGSLMFCIVRSEILRQ